LGQGRRGEEDGGEDAGAGMRHGRRQMGHTHSTSSLRAKVQSETARAERREEQLGKTMSGLARGRNAPPIHAATGQSIGGYHSVPQHLNQGNGVREGSFDWHDLEVEIAQMRADSLNRHIADNAKFHGGSPPAAREAPGGWQHQPTGHNGSIRTSEDRERRVMHGGGEAAGRTFAPLRGPAGGGVALPEGGVGSGRRSSQAHTSAQLETRRASNHAQHGGETKPGASSESVSAILPTRFEMSFQEAQAGLGGEAGLGLGLGRQMAPSPGVQQFGELREEDVSLPSIFPSQKSRFSRDPGHASTYKKTSRRAKMHHGGGGDHHLAVGK